MAKDLGLPGACAPRRGLCLAALLLALLMPLLLPVSGWAQPAAPADATPADATTAAASETKRLEALLATLEEPAARAAFVDNLKTLIAAQKAQETAGEEDLVEIPPPETLGAGIIFAISAGIRNFSEGILEGASVFRDLPDAGAWIRHQLEDRAARNFWLTLIGKLALVLVGGFAAEWLVGRFLARTVARLESVQPRRWFARALLVLAHAALALLPVMAFAAVAYLLLPFAGSSERARFVVLALVNSHVLVRLVLVLARVVLMPTAPTLRLVRLRDETAAYLYVWIRRLAAIIIYGYFLAEVAQLLGVDPAGRALLLKFVGLVAVAMLIILVLQNRRAVADWLRGDGVAEAPSGAVGVLRRRLADVWHILVAIYLIAFYTVWILDIGFLYLIRATALTIVVLVAARLLIVASGKAVERAFRVGHEMTARFPGLETRANRYLPALARVLRVVIYVIASLLILQAWGVESLAWLTSRAGVRLIGTGLGILLVLTIALALWEMIGLALDRYAARIDAGSRSSARVRTLLPLLRTIILVVMSVMVGLVVLSQIGIDITPLLAGAGVIGLAVGFGSQKLVQDVINGLFILAEDTISVGDIVQLDAHSGVVEEITIRHIRLRDFSANVITVPFSEVKTVVNMTRDYSRYVFEIGIAYKEDVDEVIAVLQSLDEEMRADPRYAALILSPLEIIGLDKFADSAVILKARYMTIPTKQWEVGREFNRRIKKRFDEKGIEIPFPHLTIYRGDSVPAKKPGAAAPLPEPEDDDAQESAAIGKPGDESNPSQP